MLNVWGMLSSDDPTYQIYRAMTTLNEVIWILINVVLGLLGVAAALFFVWIGFKLARAEDESKRKEAKKQMLFAVVAILGVIILIVLWNTVLLDALSTTRQVCIPGGGNVCP